jgi:hypothetical protein
MFASLNMDGQDAYDGGLNLIGRLFVMASAVNPLPKITILAYTSRSLVYVLVSWSFILTKTLCDLLDKIKLTSKEYRALVDAPRYVCRKCGRAANKKKRLCDPYKLKTEK